MDSNSSDGVKALTTNEKELVDSINHNAQKAREALLKMNAEDQPLDFEGRSLKKNIKQVKYLQEMYHLGYVAPEEE